MKSQEKKDRLLERIVAHFTKRIRDGKFPIDRQIQTGVPRIRR